MDNFKNLQKSLFIWGSDCSELEKNVKELKEATGGEVLVENIERLSLASHSASNFDLILIATASVNQDLFAKFLKLLKPSGKLSLSKFDDSAETILSDLKLTGFINGKFENNLILCEKPNYEIGSAVKLSFGKKSAATENVWKINADDGEEETIDEDQLLDEDDLKKPDPSSLRVCGTTGKRKACKNCSCGLAEELDTEAKSKVTANTQNAKSSCGSCYLGDAFRCSSCPYLGMPAFKPGEQVTLDLNDDV